MNSHCAVWCMSRRGRDRVSWVSAAVLVLKLIPVIAALEAFCAWQPTAWAPIHAGLPR